MRKYFPSIIALCICVVVAIGINLPAYFAVSSDRAMLNILSLDEWAYMDFLTWGWFDPIAIGDIKALAILHDPFGYGSIFWYAYGIVGLPGHWLNNFTIEIISYRMFSAVWLGIILWLVWSIVLHIRNKQNVTSYIAATFAAACVLLMPAMYFYEKAFSAEFMHVAFGLATLYTLLLFIQDKKVYWLYTSAILLGLTIGIKISAAAFLPIVVLAYIIAELQTDTTPSWWHIVKRLITSGLLTIVAFFVANPYIILLRQEGIATFRKTIEQNLQSNATNHGQSIDGFTWFTWVEQVIQPSFVPYWFLVLALISFVLALWQNRKNTLPLLTTVGIGLLYTGYIIFTVKKTWAWYLFPGMVLLPVGLAVIDISQIGKYIATSLSNRTWQYIYVGVLALILIALAIYTVPTIGKRYTEVQGREYKPTFIVKQSAKQQFDTWLATTEYTGNFLKSPYIYFDETEFSDRDIQVHSIWGSLQAEYIKNTKPTLLLIEKDYGFLLPDEKISSLSSYPQLIEERKFVNSLTTTGVEIGKKLYQYQLVFETDNFFVYARNEHTK